MRIVKGIPVSPGIAIAPAHQRRTGTAMPAQRLVPHSQIESELERFAEALEASRMELSAMADKSGLADAVGSIASSHREFLRDPTLLRQVQEAIRNGRTSAEYAVAVVFRRWIEKFRALDDEFFRQRHLDLIDLEQRVLRQLIADEERADEASTEPAILVTQDLTPSEAAALDKSRFLGFVTELGGATSHTAIIAKSLGIPAVCGLGPLAEVIPDDATLIVDGARGVVVVNPRADVLAQYRERQGRIERRFRILKRQAELPAETPDGWPVGVTANIEFPFEVDQALRNGADGIGLYRTEFLYTEGAGVPNEEAHLEAYSLALERLQGRPLVVRTFDFGADKFAAEVGIPAEPNPALGSRSLRYSFARPELFRTQLRALLRAGAQGRISVMFPMVSSVTELRRARRIMDDVAEELRREHIPYGAKIPVGAMIEIPSAAVASDLLAREADFFSIGTNDLTQYSLAVDRANERVAALFRPSNPAILRLLQTVQTEGARAQIRVTVCGEMAAEQTYTVLLLGLGIRHFSVAPAAVPEVKRVVRSITRRRAVEITEVALSLPTPEEVDAYLAEQTDQILGATWT